MALGTSHGYEKPFGKMLLRWTVVASDLLGEEVCQCCRRAVNQQLESSLHHLLSPSCYLAIYTIYTKLHTEGIGGALSHIPLLQLV